MQKVIFSDVHSNDLALIACLTDYVVNCFPSKRTKENIGRVFDNLNIAVSDKFVKAPTGSEDRIICLGDIVGYGPHPNSCFKIVTEVADVIVFGNHDLRVFCLDLDNPIGPSEQRELAVAKNKKHLLDLYLSWHWTKKQMYNTENWAKLTELICSPDAYCVTEGNLVFSHGLPNYPQEFYYHNSEEKDMFEDCLTRPEFSGRISFFGHAHKAAIFALSSNGNNIEEIQESWKGRFSLNNYERIFFSVNSIGQPRDGSNKSGYLVNSNDLFSLRRVPYDYNSTCRDIINADGLSYRYGTRLWGGF